MLLSFLSVLSVFSLCEVYFFSSSRLFNRATTHPVRNARYAFVITYLGKGKKSLYSREINSSADTEVSEGGGRGCASGANQTFPCRPWKKSHRIHSGKRRAHTTASYQQDPWAVARCPCRSSFSSRNYRLWEPTLGLFLKDCIPWKEAMLEQLLGNSSTWEGSIRGICERLHHVGGTWHWNKWKVRRRKEQQRQNVMNYL